MGASGVIKYSLNELQRDATESWDGRDSFLSPFSITYCLSYIIHINVFLCLYILFILYRYIYSAIVYSFRRLFQHILVIWCTKSYSVPKSVHLVNYTIQWNTVKLTIGGKKIVFQWGLYNMSNWIVQKKPFPPKTEQFLRFQWWITV